MRRRRWLLAIVVAAAVAAAAGALVVTGFNPTGEEAVAKPSGTQNVLRVQPLSDTVACSDQKQVVQVFLDDLEAHPSAQDPAFSGGVSDFQFSLAYDPKVLQIQAPIDVELNPLLDREDPDQDGAARSFFLLGPVIDNYEGRVLVGASSLPPGPKENFEEGIDPVAKGEPLLLITFRFLTVGQGTSPLAVYRTTDTGPQAEVWRTILIDPDLTEYAPVLTKDSSLTVRGGKCAEPLPATPRPIPTPTPEPPTATPPVIPPWRTVVPTPAAEAARTDCPPGWNVYQDQQDRFSICYPDAWSGTASPDALNLLNPRGADQQENLISVTVSWGLMPNFRFEPSPESCKLLAHPALGEESSTFVTVQVSGRSVPACLTQGFPATLLGALPLADDGSAEKGFINFAVDYTGPAEERMLNEGQALLDTLKIFFK